MRTTLFFAMMVLAVTISKAQSNAITSFSLMFPVSMDYEFWTDETNDFKYEDENKEIKTIRTIDTLFAYAQKTIGAALQLDLQPQKVEGKVKLNALGKVTGFPNAKLKEAVAAGKYDHIVEVDVTTLSGGATVTESGPFAKRKQKVDMIVEITVYDSKGKETARYKKRTRMDEVKTSVAVYGFSKEITLSGNELYALFVDSLDNALKNKK